MMTARYEPQTAVINGKIYAIGGTGVNNIVLNSAEVFTIEATDITSPASLTASGRDSNIGLSWGAVAEATSYNIYRALTSGGPYTQIATGVAKTTYIDAAVTNGTAYYYVITAFSSSGESEYSNEAWATPNKEAPDSAILNIYMSDGTPKEYDLPMTEVTVFIEWYDQRATGTGKAYFIIEKAYNKGPFTARKDYIIFDKIRDFSVNQYE